MAREFNENYAGTGKNADLKSCCFCGQRPTVDIDGSKYRIYCRNGCNITEADLKGKTDEGRKKIMVDAREQWNRINFVAR